MTFWDFGLAHVAVLQFAESRDASVARIDVTKSQFKKWAEQNSNKTCGCKNVDCFVKNTNRYLN